MGREPASLAFAAARTRPHRRGHSRLDVVDSGIDRDLPQMAEASAQLASLVHLRYGAHWEIVPARPALGDRNRCACPLPRVDVHRHLLVIRCCKEPYRRSAGLTTPFSGTRRKPSQGSISQCRYDIGLAYVRGESARVVGSSDPRTVRQLTNAVAQLVGCQPTTRTSAESDVGTTFKRRHPRN